MNVPKLSFLEKTKKNQEYFLSLVLRDEKVSAVVFTQANQRINVVGEHEEPFKTSLDDSTEEELLNTIDRAVSSAERVLPDGVESKKTIFGVKADWTNEEGKISKEYLAKLKKISGELDFEPMGFLIVPEAIAHLIHKQEGAPLSGVLAEIGSKTATVYLIKAGRVIESKTGPLEDHQPVDVVENLLKRTTASEILPSKIIIFDSGNEKLQQEFIAHKWDKALPFLHVPQITNLPAHFDSKAVLSGAATQMGLEFLDQSLTRAVENDEKEIEPVKDVLPEEDKTLAEVVEQSDFGFSSEDIKEKPKTAIDDEIIPVKKAPVSDNFETATLSEQVSEIPEELKVVNADKRSLPINAAMLTTGISSFLSKIKLGKISGAATRSPKLLLAGIVLILLIALVLFLYIFQRSAVVTLSINSKSAEKDIDVTFSSSESTDTSKNIIKSDTVTVSEDGKVSTSTTGKTQTGDKAKGTVTIFNNNENSATIPSGTTITSSNGLEFVTDKAVSVASASGDIFSGTTPGKANVNVTAAKFGTNYNLPSDTKFSVNGSSSIAAKNDDAFSGGTKKDVKVVSKDDLAKLTSDLQKQLESKAKDDIKGKISGDSELLSDFTSVSFTHKSFSKQVDDQADTVSLTATIEYDGISYKKSDMVNFAKEKLKENIGDNMTINENAIELNIENVKTSSSETTGKLNIKAGIIPQIDQAKVINDIKGKSVDEATATLSQIPQIGNMDISIHLNLPLLPKKLPFQAGKIKLVVNNG